VDKQQAYEATKCRGLWIYGKPGTGKSRWARERAEANGWKLYAKAQNKWFDGYTGQEMILLDDLDMMGTKLSHLLKIWSDRYPCQGETKGGTVQLNHREFLITSNYHPAELWPEDTILLAAIKRRFIMHKFNNLYV